MKIQKKLGASSLLQSITYLPTTLKLFTILLYIRLFGKHLVQLSMTSCHLLRDSKVSYVSKV